MRKTAVLGLLISLVVGCFVITGCGNKQESKKSNTAANLLSAQDSSLESAGVGGWHAAYATCTLANSTTWAAVGTHSLKITPTEGYAPWLAIDVTAVTSAATPYTVSYQFKGIAGKWYSVVLYDDVSGLQYVPNFFQADGTTQRMTFTGTFGAGSTYRELGFFAAETHTAAQIIYADNFRIVAGIDLRFSGLSGSGVQPSAFLRLSAIALSFAISISRACPHSASSRGATRSSSRSIRFIINLLSLP